MHRLVLLAAALALPSPAVAIAKDPAASPPTAPGAGKMVCKRQALTGTRFARKICYTAADWDAKAEADRRALAEMTGNQVQRESGRN